jgi:hypothetical protein
LHRQYDPDTVADVRSFAALLGPPVPGQLRRWLMPIGQASVHEVRDLAAVQRVFQTFRRAHAGTPFDEESFLVLMRRMGDELMKLGAIGPAEPIPEERAP